MAHLKGLVIGVANDHSIAWGCAQALHAAGAEIAMTYLNDKAKPYVAPLAQSVNASLFLPLDLNVPGQFEAVFAEVEKKWGKLDFVVHSIAYAPKDDLFGRVVDCSREGFLSAMDVSCYSLIRVAKAAEPLMNEGGSILTLSYYGAEKVVPGYSIMGPVKAALEASMRYLAMDLGQKGIRINALSPGPVKTRAASGLPNFDRLYDKVAQDSPLPGNPVTIEQIGEYAAFLVSPGARHVTGQVLYIDGGYCIRGT